MGSKIPVRTGVRWPLWIAAALLLAGAGCASGTYNRAYSAIADAEFEIEAAEEVRADLYAQPQLELAHRNVEAAKVAVQNDKPNEATRLAQRSKVEAQLAEALTMKARAEDY